MRTVVAGATGNVGTSAVRATAASSLADGDPLGTGHLTTHQVPPEEAPQAYEMLQKEDGASKVVLEP